MLCVHAGVSGLGVASSLHSSQVQGCQVGSANLPMVMLQPPQVSSVGHVVQGSCQVQGIGMTDPLMGGGNGNGNQAVTGANMCGVLGSFCAVI
jgi:hypothetical protein